MADLVHFRVHFEGSDAAPFDTMASDANDARKRAEKARPDELIRKVKVVRENAHV